jgi:hypothetical protein
MTKAKDSDYEGIRPYTSEDTSAFTGRSGDIDQVKLSSPFKQRYEKKDDNNVLITTDQFESLFRTGDKDIDIENKKLIKQFVSERSKIHSLYILENEKTKRLTLILSAFLAISGGCILIFAPEGREVLANWIGGAFLILSAGAAGYKRLWAKTDKLSIGTESDG